MCFIINEVHSLLFSKFAYQILILFVDLFGNYIFCFINISDNLFKFVNTEYFGLNLRLTKLF